MKIELYRQVFHFTPDMIFLLFPWFKIVLVPFLCPHCSALDGAQVFLLFDILLFNSLLLAVSCLDLDCGCLWKGGDI